MKFRIGTFSNRCTDRALVYIAEDYSFDVEPGIHGYTSIVVNDLSLEVDQAGRMVNVWGYCPHQSWRPSKILPPPANNRELFVMSDEPLLSGVAQSVNRDRRWATYVDRQSGWICIDSSSPARQHVEVLPGVIVGLGANEELAVLYLKPKRLPESQ